MKIVCLLSGGIDSPVAAAMLSRKHDTVLVNFETIQEKEKIQSLAMTLAKLSGKKMRLYIVPHGDNLRKLSPVAKKYTCVICKRMMHMMANMIAEKERADATATGDSLAQVASQTLKNLRAEDAASKLTVLRPLIGMEKSEIIEMAKEIGTYDISIGKDRGACPGVPKYPETRAELDEVERIEKEAGIEEMARNSVRSAKTTVLG